MTALHTIEICMLNRAHWAMHRLIIQAVQAYNRAHDLPWFLRGYDIAGSVDSTQPINFDGHEFELAAEFTRTMGYLRRLRAERIEERNLGRAGHYLFSFSRLLNLRIATAAELQNARCLVEALRESAVMAPAFMAAAQ